MGLLPCPLPCHAHSGEENQSHSYYFRSGYSSCSSSSSLSSQKSFQSLPSLSLSTQQLDQQPSTVYHQCVSTLKGHTSYVFNLVLSGKQLYSGSHNDEIRVWSRELTTHHQNEAHNNGNLVATANGAVKSLVVLRDKLFSAHQDHKIRVWKIDNNHEGHHKKYQCIATLPTMNDRFLKLFSTKNYVQVRRHKSCTWVHHVDTVSALALSRDGSLLYSASWDRTFKVWQTSDFRCLESVVNAHDDAINALILSKDGHVYTGSADKTINVWKKHHGQRKHTLVTMLQKHKSAVNALALSSDESVLYSGACDRSILVWERVSNGGGNMVAVGALRGHSKAILCLTVVSDMLCSGSADKTIRIWRRSSGLDKSHVCLAVLEGHMKPVKCLTAAVDTKNSHSSSGSSYLIYSGSLDCDIKVWRVWIPQL